MACIGTGKEAERIGMHLEEIKVQDETTFRRVTPLGQCPECGRLVGMRLFSGIVNGIKIGRIAHHNGYTLPLTGGDSDVSRDELQTESDSSEESHTQDQV